MVKVVLPISSLLSKKGLMLMPGGNDGEICATRSLTASITAFEFASFNIITCPSTFSPSPFPVIAPKRVACPKPTEATSFMKTGIPFRIFNHDVFNVFQETLLILHLL